MSPAHVPLIIEPADFDGMSSLLVTRARTGGDYSRGSRAVQREALHRLMDEQKREGQERREKEKQAKKTIVAPVTAPAPRTKKQGGQTSLQRSLREGEAEEERWMHEEQKWATHFEFMMKAEEEWDAAPRRSEEEDGQGSGSDESDDECHDGR